ncbi:MAG: phosphotransferase [Mycobacterium sp.]
MLTGEQLAARSARAVRAAVDAAGAQGLSVDHPAVLHDVFSVVVHLRPEPVVARIQVVVPLGMTARAQAARQQRELDVVTWLAGQGVPVIAPSDLVPRKPVRRDGFSMTFWELADVTPEHVPYSGVGVEYTARLNATLSEYPAALPFLAPFNTGLPNMLAALQESSLLTAGDITRARAEYHALHELLGSRESFESSFPGVAVQALHGDGPAHNVIRTTDGVRFSDFEDVTCGPAEWDLAMMGEAANAEYDVAAQALGLRATDPELQRLMDAARTLQFIGCVTLIPQLPVLRDGLIPAIEAWRAGPPIG